MFPQQGVIDLSPGKLMVLAPLYLIACGLPITNAVLLLVEGNQEKR